MYNIQKPFLASFWALIFSLLCFAKLSAATAPNILVFLVDDLGWRDLACYGSDVYETPAIDKLSQDGMTFTQAYAAHPRCVPSRYGFFTGKFPARDGVPGNSYNIAAEEVTMGEALKEAGYTTYYAGKWHLGKKPEEMPDAQGFDINIAGGAAGAPSSYFAPYDKVKSKGHKTEANLNLDAPNGEYLTDRLTDETVQFLENYAAGGQQQPFFAVLAHYAVHTPFEAKEEDVEYFESKIGDVGEEQFVEKDGSTKMQQDNATYAAMIKSTDESMAKILATLDYLNLADDTIVILTSDHGGLSNRGAQSNRPLATSNLPLRAGKGHLYEGGVRVPFIVRWPDHVSPGSKSTAVINGSDVYPTLLDIAGAPGKPEQHIDGVSFTEALQGKVNRRAPIIWHSPRPRPNGTGDTGASAMRDGDYKLMKFYFPEVRYELYDLTTDPEESHNLANEMPELCDELAAKLNASLAAMNAIEVKEGRR